MLFRARLIAPNTSNDHFSGKEYDGDIFQHAAVHSLSSGFKAEGVFLKSKTVPDASTSCISIPAGLKYDTSYNQGAFAHGGFKIIDINVPLRAMEIINKAVNQTREYLGKEVDLTLEGQDKISKAFNANEYAPVEFLKAASDAGVFNDGLDLDGLTLV